MEDAWRYRCTLAALSLHYRHCHERKKNMINESINEQLSDHKRKASPDPH